LHTPSPFCRVALTRAQDAAAELELSPKRANPSRGSWKLLNIRLGGLLPCSEAGDAGEAAEVDDHVIDHVTTTVSSCMQPGAPGALPVLPPGVCWQLQDAPDYHLSRARGQGRLRRCEGVLWTFKHRKISKSRKRALLGHLARSGPRRAHRLASTLPAVARATVVCFLRCECLRGRDVGRPRDPSRRWGARCSSGRVNLENGASVRLCGPYWEPLKTDGQSCDEHTWHPKGKLSTAKEIAWLFIRL
jgi:hypothetical protein